MSKTKQKNKTESNRPTCDASSEWATFALPPLCVDVPYRWYPKISEWTETSARARWETLTGTPLEIHWTWSDLKRDADEREKEKVRKRMEKAWIREVKNVEEHSRKARVNFKWTTEAESVQHFFSGAQHGMVREYLWEGRAGFLTVANLEQKGKRRAFVGAAICPPDGTRDPRKVALRILESLRICGPDEPVRLAIAGLEVELPSEFVFDGLRGNEGQLYADFQSQTERFLVGRTNFSDLHLAVTGQVKVWGAMAAQLFDRGTTPDPIMTLVRSGIQLTGRDPDADKRQVPEDGEKVGEHEAGLYLEKRKVHVRFGDAVMKRMGRRFSGGAAALTWNCKQSHSVWGICVRSGQDDVEQSVRNRLSVVNCHDSLHPAQVNWRPFTEEEASSPKAEKKPDPKGEAEEGQPKSAMESEAMRRKQLRLKLKGRPEVRLERYDKDGTGALVYKGAPAKGFLATMLRGSAEANVSTRHLALDLVGRRVWELLEEGCTVARLIADLSTEFGLHPVEAYPKVMTFLKPLAERRMLEVMGPKSAEREDTEEALQGQRTGE